MLVARDIQFNFSAPGIITLLHGKSSQHAWVFLFNTHSFFPLIKSGSCIRYPRQMTLQRNVYSSNHEQKLLIELVQEVLFLLIRILSRSARLQRSRVQDTHSEFSCPETSRFNKERESAKELQQNLQQAPAFK